MRRLKRSNLVPFAGEQSPRILARVFDHTTGRFTRGYNMLTLGWSNGFSFAPIDFVMLSSAKLVNRLCEMKEQISKRSHGYKRRTEAVMPKPEAVVAMLDRALQAGFSADYVLMDSWFTQAPLLQELSKRQLHVIGMVKQLKQRYRLGDERFTLKELYSKARTNKSSEIQGSITVKLDGGLPVKLVFVSNRNKRREWLAIYFYEMKDTNKERDKSALMSQVHQWIATFPSMTYALRGNTW